jgi:hypothetical protein
MNRAVIANVRGVLGAVAGGAIGFYTFYWLYHQGFYGLVLPGALLGLGCGLAAGQPSLARGIICGLAALPFALFSDWRTRFGDQPLLSYLHDISALENVPRIMVVLGGLIAFWMAKEAGFSRSKPNPPAEPNRAMDRQADPPA